MILTEAEKVAKAVANIERMTHRLRWATKALEIAPLRRGAERALFLEAMRLMVAEGAPVQLLADQAGITRATLNRLLGRFIPTAGPEEVYDEGDGEVLPVEPVRELVAAGADGFWG